MSAPAKNPAKQEQAALALAIGATIEKAAQKAGCSERTVRRWKADCPEFVRRIGELRAELTERTMGRLIGAQVKASGTLRRLLTVQDPRVRLGAAKALIELGWRAREHGDLAAEVAELRQIIEELRPPAGKGGMRLRT
jgi:hypothetical protein